MAEPITGRTLFRYGLWAGLMQTSYARKQATGLLTAWIFHSTINSFLLFLPEIYRALAAVLGLDGRANDGDAVPGALHQAICDVVAKNPRYVDYVAPVVIAFLLAHPKFDLYKSDWANEQLFGLGLDSIPHAATAFAFCSLVLDALAALDRRLPRGGALARLAGQAHRHADLVALGALALATAGYETGEYLIHRSELRQVGGDERRVAMDWSGRDTLEDVIANISGGLLALAYRRWVTSSHVHRIVGKMRFC